MSQDTRKDKRAKVVSLNVRYKSATVDEFIENHSHDVSKGGLFVKTPTPFPPGTLLKFEIRLAGDKSVISGVGRVVWKREPTQAGAEKPAGMGVKFIKIDDSSRAIIDRLITQKADAGSAYTSEQPIDEAPPVVGHPSTLRGLVAAAPVDPPTAAPAPAPVNVPAAPGAAASKLPTLPTPPPPAAAAKANVSATLAGPRPSGLPGLPAALPVPPPAPSSKPMLGAKPAPRPIGKNVATVMGVAPPGLLPPAKGSEPKLPPSEPKVPPSDAKPPASEPKLPPTPGAPPPRPVAPARKATMMGMGIPSSPPPGEAGTLPSPMPPPAAGTPSPPKTAEPMFPAMDPESGGQPAGEQTVMKQAAELLEEALKEAGGSMEDIGQNPLFAKQGDAPLLELGVPSSRQQSGDTMIMPSPIAAAESPPLVAPAVSAVAPRPPSSPPQPPAKVEPRRLSDDLAPAGKTAKKKGGGAGVVIGLLAVVAVVGGGVYAWRSGMLAGVIGPVGGPPSASTVPMVASSPPSASSSAPVMAVAPPSAEGGPEATDASAAMAMSDAAAAMATDASAAMATDAAVDAVKPDAGKPAAVAPRPAPAPRPRPPVMPAPPPTGDTPPPETPAPTPTPAPAPVPAPTKDPANEL